VLWYCWISVLPPTLLTTVDYYPCSAVASELWIRLSIDVRCSSANKCRHTTWKHSSPAPTWRTAVYPRISTGTLEVCQLHWRLSSADLITSYRLGYHLYAV